MGILSFLAKEKPMDVREVAKGLLENFEVADKTIITTYAARQVLKATGYPAPYWNEDIWREAVDLVFPKPAKRRYASRHSKGMVTDVGYTYAIRDLKPKPNKKFQWELGSDGLTWILKD